MFEKRITKQDINELPLFKYEGKTVIAADEKQIDKAIFEIEKHDLVGLDTETKPTFKKGQFNHVALIQIAVPEKVYLLRIHRVGITNTLANFFSNDQIIKVGIALDDDLIALNKRRRFNPGGFLDLNKIAPTLGIENIGARNLSALLLNFRISKNQQVSNWENPILTQHQIKYAATDAWICLEMYNKLNYWGYLD
ncbi:MAG: 3'-5' exonuclease domain-containing protein 2 [Cyclobacteriaceae bacterium]|nr:3'-5' exonuclease domain-containing protein 2 [Cyclobacteriaceae bacterium]